MRSANAFAAPATRAPPAAGGGAGAAARGAEETPTPTPGRFDGFELGADRSAAARRVFRFLGFASNSLSLSSHQTLFSPVQ